MGAVKTGGQGSVYKGRRVGEIITAIKLLPTPILSQSEEDKHYRDFSNEVKKLQRVNEEPNPNIVKILSYGVSETGCFPFIEMEYIEGPDLGELLKPPYPPVFSIREVIKVAEHLSHALAHCHKLDVKHGDIKSNNVKYNKQTGNYVLLDFGLAILSDEERRTSLRQAGAIEFMAPEQNEGKIFFQTDVYSFGIVLFELLAGKVPFPLDGNSETARNKVMIAHMEATPPDVLSLRAAMLPADWSEEQKAQEMQVPDWLVSLLYKCLQKRPEDRFENGTVLHDYVCHHRIYTAEVAGLVQKEDSRWKALISEKEFELQDLKAIIARQDRELQMARQRNGVAFTETAERRTVSQSAFNALLFAFLLAGAIAVYGFFFRRPVVDAANSKTELLQDEDSLAAKQSEPEPPVVKKKKPLATPVERKAEPADDKDDDTIEKKETLLRKGKPEFKKRTADSMALDEATETKEEKKADSSENNEQQQDSQTVRYKVRSRAYFHNEPEADTKRNAFVTHWDHAVKALDEADGFIYVEFTNDEGQTSKGWLAKEDLIRVK